jgi:hypothetical protein
MRMAAGIVHSVIQLLLLTDKFSDARPTSRNGSWKLQLYCISLLCIYTYVFSARSLLKFQTLDNWVTELLYQYIGERVI